VIVLVLAACALFGAADQYVGSLSRFWSHAWEIPALSAPWLVLPFLVGRSRRDPVSAALFGAVGTLLALVGYALMTISPIEHAHFSVVNFLAFARSNALWFLGAVISGPPFGFLGYRWRVARARVAASLTAGAVLIEPLVHAIRFQQLPLSHIPFGTVTSAELVVGGAMAVWFGWQRAQAARPSETVPVAT
jgi:hypothetical protein